MIRSTDIIEGRNLPPAILDPFPGTTSLIPILDKKIFIGLRDGKKFIGTLRSYDQYGNIVLHDTIERLYIGQEYGEQACGIYLIRGENIILMGEYDPTSDLQQCLKLEKKPMIEVLTKQREKIEEHKALMKLKRQIQRDFGLLEADIMADFDAI